MTKKQFFEQWGIPLAVGMWMLAPVIIEYAAQGIGYLIRWLGLYG